MNPATIHRLRRSRRLLLVLPLALLPTIAANAGRDEASTVGSVAEDNGLQHDGYLISKTPSIMRLEMSESLPADPAVALASYDRILELPNVDPLLRAEAMRRAAYLRLQKVESGESGEADLQRAIAIYRQLLAEIPNDAGNDRALYQLGRAYQAAGDTEQSIVQLQELGRRYPQSPLTGDGVFRVAELLFARQRFAEAEANYRVVMNQGASTPLFRPAEFKYGWTLYKQSRYADALPVFLGILQRDLPAGEIADADQAFTGVKRDRLEMAQESLRVAGLSFAAMGGGGALNDYFARAGEPRFGTLLYQSVGARLLERQQYTAAAGTFSAFVERHPLHARAPDFQTQVIAAYQQGGFKDLVIKAKENYATLYAPDAAYWKGRSPDAAVLAQARTHMDELAHYYQAAAQSTPASDAQLRRTRFLVAANWYQRTIELFPNDPKAGDLSLLYADALYDGGKTREAADAYSRTAYGRAGYAKAPEAAFAAVQAYQRLAVETTGSGHDAALRESVSASVKLADTFNTHPQWANALSRASEDLYSLGDHEQALAVAQRVLNSGKPLSTELREQNLSVVADAQFARKQYPQAETAYVELLKLLAGNDPERAAASDKLAASIYKQGEAARDAGQLADAATTFLRVGRLVPQAGIRANADYDAASAYYALKNWPATETTLEDFRQRYPQHALAADVDKRLALVYENDAKPRQAADAYSRVARRASETVQVRSDAAWLAATLYDGVHQPLPTSQAYEYYLMTFSASLDRGLQARRRLADIARDDQHDVARYERWLGEIVGLDRGAGGNRSDASKLMAAQASLEIGRNQAVRARQLALSLPVEQSLPRRKAATESAIASLNSAASYGFAEVTTAATFELGSVYRDFGRAILQSARPGSLQGEALAQYDLLLEEQAFPFEEKAIQAYEANLGRMQQGVWNDWIHRSANALVELSPGKYGKHDQRETIYDSLL